MGRPFGGIPVVRHAGNRAASQVLDFECEHDYSSSGARLRLFSIRSTSAGFGVRTTTSSRQRAAPTAFAFLTDWARIAAASSAACRKFIAVLGGRYDFVTRLFLRTRAHREPQIEALSGEEGRWRPMPAAAQSDMGRCVAARSRNCPYRRETKPSAVLWGATGQLSDRRYAIVTPPGSSWSCSKMTRPLCW